MVVRNLGVVGAPPGKLPKTAKVAKFEIMAASSTFQGSTKQINEAALKQQTIAVLSFSLITA